MSQTGFESSSIVETYRQRTPGSAVLFEEACSMFPSGIEFNGFPGGTISGAHSKTDLILTIEAFEESLNMLQSENEI